MLCWRFFVLRLTPFLKGQDPENHKTSTINPTMFQSFTHSQFLDDCCFAIWKTLFETRFLKVVLKCFLVHQRPKRRYLVLRGINLNQQDFSQSVWVTCTLKLPLVSKAHKIVSRKWLVYAMSWSYMLTSIHTGQSNVKFAADITPDSAHSSLSQGKL